MQRIRGILLIAVAAMLFSCEKLIVTAPESDQNIEDFEFAWHTVNSVYQYLEFKQIDWDSIYTVYRPKAEKSRGDEIYQVLHDLLVELKDGHVYYHTNGGGLVYPYYPTPRMRKDRKAFSPFVVRKYFNEELHVTGDDKFEYGIMNENIGYIFISAFAPNGIANTFATALKYVKDTKGLIIDDRNGAGGNRIDVYQIVSRFVTSPLESPVWYELGQLEQWQPIEPGGPFQYTRPVVVLINGASFSGRELFADLMKQLPNVTVVGDTTGGGSSGVEGNVPELSGNYVLPSGKLIRIPTIDGRRSDGLPWESIGVPPDIRLPQTEEDIKLGRDKQLEYAIELLK